jgi:purine-cytosine permease-like protein
MVSGGRVEDSIMAENPSKAVNEYEREPVPERALLGLKSYVGQFAGEHVAGTELMIGPLFVAGGVSAFDMIIGLLAGNILAVLSWTLLTAPIATRARMPLYFQLEKICGRKLVTVYNVANGVMFSFLAGAMITVSTTALGVWFQFRMPGLNDLLPNSIGWVLGVLAMGFLFSIVAASGYKSVSRFANIAVPWMVVIFLAFGIIGLRELGLKSIGDFWTLAQSAVWKGGDPLPGQTKFTFWHTLFFAWFCNMAWHIGMADLSLFRYARKSWYGLASASGMFVGHYMAWITASILFALQLHENPANTTVLPGPLAFRACGVAGLLCVIAAGWTTANPTLYRAGLAFQAIIPRSSRFWVTFAVGIAASITAIFPLVTMKLLDFVALWGMILMPMGAVVFVDFWLIEKFGLKKYYCQASGCRLNWAAGLAWLVTVATSSFLVLRGNIQIYFVGLPGWFLAAVLYILFSFWIQKKPIKAPLTMERTS